MERGSRAVGVAGAARSRRRGHGPPRRAKRTLDALGTSQRCPGRGQEKQAKRRAACTPDDRGRLAPLPSGKGRGGWERVAHQGGLLRSQAVAWPFLKTLRRWCTDSGGFWPGRWCCARGHHPAPFGGLDMRVSAKREGCSEAKPLGDAGWEREARAEGRLRPAGAGRGLAP